MLSHVDILHALCLKRATSFSLVVILLLNRFFPHIRLLYFQGYDLRGINFLTSQVKSCRPPDSASEPPEVRFLQFQQKLTTVGLEPPTSGLRVGLFTNWATRARVWNFHSVSAFAVIPHFPLAIHYLSCIPLPHINYSARIARCLRYININFNSLPLSFKFITPCALRPITNCFAAALIEHVHCV